MDSVGSAWRLLRTRRFGTFWCASLLSNIGTWAQQVAQPWLLLSLGASSLVIGLDAFALSAPAWMLTLLGGALADGADRRKVIARFQSVQMLCPLVLVGLLFVDARRDRRGLCSWFAAGYGVILVLAALNPWFVLLPVLLAAAGIAMSVSNISSNTLLQASTTARLRGQTVSLYMLAMRGGLSLGSLLTGVTVSLLGVNHALLLNGMAALLAQGLVARSWNRAVAPDTAPTIASAD